MYKYFGILLLWFGFVGGKPLPVMIISQKSGAVIPVCMIRSSECDSFYYTDVHGRVLIYCPEQGCSLHVSVTGHIDTIISILPYLDTLKIAMREKSIISELVKIKVTAFRSTSDEYYLRNKSVLFSPAEIYNTAGAAGDISRYIASHPSTVASITDGYDNTLYIRGGRPNEILFIVDGIELDNVNHFSRANGSGGPVGFINTEFINNANFFAGNMPSVYPSRLSSVIDINMRNGSLTKYKGTAGVKLTGGMLSFEGPLLQDAGSFAGAMRYVDFSKLSEIAKEKGIPKLGDLFTKLIFLNKNNMTMSFTGLLSFNKFKYHYPVTYSSHAGTDLFVNVKNEIEKILQGGLGITINLDTRISHQFNIAYSFRNGKRYDSLSNFNSEFFLNNFASNPIYFNSNDKSKAMLKYKNVIPVTETDTISAGSNVNRQSVSMKRGEFSQYSGTCIECVDNEPVTAEWTKKTDADSIAISGFEYGGFFNLNVNRSIVKCDLGLRLDHYGLLKSTKLSPSFTLSLMPGNLNVFSLHFGLYHQFPSEITAVIFDNLSYGNVMSSDSLKHLELELLKKVKPYRCFHYGAGYKTRIFDNIYVQSDLYYKWYDSEFYYANQYYIRILEHRNNMLTVADQNGKRKSMGIELLLRSSESLWYHYSIGGSIIRVFNKYNNDKWYNDWTDVGYTLNISTRVSFLEYNSFSFSVSAMGGRPYTRQKIVDDCIGRKYAINTDDNNWLNARLEKICTVNARYACKGTIGRTSIEGSVEVLNLFNFQPVLDYQFNGERFIKVTPFGFTPILGLLVCR